LNPISQIADENDRDVLQLLAKIGSFGVATFGFNPFKDGDVPVVEAGWKALRSRRRYYDLRMSDRCCERRKIGTNVVSIRAH
jgi:hypothetical protein